MKKSNDSLGHSELAIEKTRGSKKWLGLFFATVFILVIWLALDQKLLFGEAWLSETYDNPDWKTNEGNLHTYGAWDLETHIWKTEYITQNFPNYEWNPYWYLGMPLLKYYQIGFYIVHIIVIAFTGLSAAKSALMMIIFGHLIATLFTFFLCYKLSRKIWISALCATFVLSNTFLSLRSYGWEPITVVFLFLYPLGLYLFLREPLRPFRFWLILILGISFLAHPLIWFSLCMIMGIYLLSVALRQSGTTNLRSKHYVLQFIGIVILSLFIGAVQFLPQITYNQVTSGAHMGLQYLPYYQVPPNIISLKDFFFDAGNLKGPGPIIMISFFLLIIFAYIHYISKKKNYTKQLHKHVLIMGLTAALLIMIAFYYMEFYNIFPMNFLRSIQYHRIIPEFVITAALLVAVLSKVIYTHKQKVMYYSMLIAFVIASGIIIYSVQNHWETTKTISDKPEFIHDTFPGRISFPFTDQSLAVRNSFTNTPQTYGYYEQGITNAYADEIFSVSSGYHNAHLTILYLKAADVSRLYINREEGERDKIVFDRLSGVLPFVQVNNSRYAYFEIPLTDPSFSQAVNENAAAAVQKLNPQCRIMFKETYCGSVKEEFVSTDTEEIRYLTAYVNLTDSPYEPKATMDMLNPNEYVISVKNAEQSTAVIVKMTHDPDFSATVHGKKVPITSIGPDFMLISPHTAGNYVITLKYSTGKLFLAGFIVSLVSILSLSAYFIIQRMKRKKNKKLPPENASFYLYMKRGNMK
ncbi:hypothetical protein C4573_07375 [Candidatus Woesearchaeota archaeon]|nr:MAG: hypothetical protein C4573_07375 [Candidatus Woesearchaeota archaeon]